MKIDYASNLNQQLLGLKAVILFLLVNISRIDSFANIPKRKNLGYRTHSFPPLAFCQECTDLIIADDSIASSKVFEPIEIGADIWIGTIVSLIPIIWATIEFTSRIRVQRQCLVCSGSGLVYTTKSGNELSRPRKCWNCGGFLPWLGWKMFFLSTFFDIGNGGVLQRPARDYLQNNEEIRRKNLEKSDEEGK